MLLSIDGVDYSDLVEEPSYSGEDGPAVVLECVFRERLSRSLKYRPLEVSWEVGGEILAGFRGEVVSLDARGYITELVAATTSYWAERHPLKRELDIVRGRPSDVLFEAAATLPYPGIDIPYTPRPRMTRTLGEAFRWTNNTSEVYEAVREESGLRLIDSPLSVARGRKKLSINTDSASRWTFTEGVDIPEGELEVGEILVDKNTGETEELESRYGFVVVYREQGGEHVELARVAVDNGDERVPRGAEYLVELSDATEDEEAEEESPYEIAIHESRRLSENRVSLDFPVVYAPFFVERYTPVTVVGVEIAREGTYRRTYRARLTSVACEAVSGSLKAVGAPVKTEFIPRPANARERRGRVAAHRRAYGHDWLGRQYLDESLPWVSVSEDGRTVLVDEEMAASYGVIVGYNDSTRRIEVH